MTTIETPVFIGYPSNISISGTISPEPARESNQSNDSPDPMDPNVATKSEPESVTINRIMTEATSTERSNTSRKVLKSCNCKRLLHRMNRKFWMSSCGCRCRFAEIYTIRCVAAGTPFSRSNSDNMCITRVQSQVQSLCNLYIVSDRFASGSGA